MTVIEIGEVRDRASADGTERVPDPRVIGQNRVMIIDPEPVNGRSEFEFVGAGAEEGGDHGL